MRYQGALVADVGGTNIRMAVATADGLQHPLTWRCGDFDTIGDALRAYLDQIEIGGPLSRGAIAVACPVESDSKAATRGRLT